MSPPPPPVSTRARPPCAAQVRALQRAAAAAQRLLPARVQVRRSAGRCMLGMPPGNPPHGLTLTAAACPALLCSFGEAPAAIALGFGHRAVALLAAVLRSGTALLGPATVADLLQAASYLQVCWLSHACWSCLAPACHATPRLLGQPRQPAFTTPPRALLPPAPQVAVVLQAAERYLQEEVLDSHSGLVLRVALDLQLAGLAHHIEQDFLQVGCWCCAAASVCVCWVWWWHECCCCCWPVCVFGGIDGCVGLFLLWQHRQGPHCCRPLACSSRLSQHFFMLSGDKAAAMLREWPPPQRRQLLHSPQLCAPTECCLVEVGVCSCRPARQQLWRGVDTWVPAEQSPGLFYVPVLAACTSIARLHTHSSRLVPLPVPASPDAVPPGQGRQLSRGGRAAGLRALWGDERARGGGGGTLPAGQCQVGRPAAVHGADVAPAQRQGGG